MKAKWFVLAVVILMTVICIPTFAAVRVGAVEDVPEAEPVGLQDSGYYTITKFDGGYGFDVEWRNFGCQYKYEFRCVDGDLVDPPPVGRLCVKIGNQKLDCDIEIPGVQKYHDYQTIRWERTISEKCNAYLPKLKLCPPCPVCEPESTTLCSIDGCQ